MRIACLLIMVAFAGACNALDEETPGVDTMTLRQDTLVTPDSAVVRTPDTTNLAVNKIAINTGDVQPHELIEFAKTLIGTRYKYGSTDPAQGFDCSGFITYVFNHFKIKVPRSSIDFTEVGRTVDLDSAKAGDLILFTGTDSTERHIGHMGIITKNENGQAEFIHSTSGKQYGVIITPLNRYYMGRFMRTARIFRQNEQ